MKSKLYYLHTITGLHVGTGQGIGVIDMPIARERATNLPQVPGSGIKGVLRDECYLDKHKNNASDEEKEKYTNYLALFGPEMRTNTPSFASETRTNTYDFAGALAVGDARLLCLPIRSWKGTFAWVTCPMILQRYKRDLVENKMESGEINFDFGDNDKNAFHTGNDSTKLKEGENIYLEDLDLMEKEGAMDWAELIAKQIFDTEEWQTLFKERFLIVHDNVFDFLSETATEIRARIKIKEDTRTVQQGGLWYEEYLPAETLMWGIIASDRPRNDNNKTAEELLKLLPQKERLQIGGNATVGAGQTRWIMQGAE